METNVEDILRHAFVERPCNVCGGQYRVTLYDVLQEQRLQGSEWKPRCQECHAGVDSLVRRVSQERIEALASAWTALREDLGSDALRLQVD